MDRIQPHKVNAVELLLVRLFRRWSAARALDQDALVAMTRMSAEAGKPAVTAVALHSVLQITEGHLCRPLEPSCHGSVALSADEKALLILLAAAPPVGAPSASAELPHGLPAILCWAVAILRETIGDRLSCAPLAEHGCPFGKT